MEEKLRLRQGWLLQPGAIFEFACPNAPQPSSVISVNPVVRLAARSSGPSGAANQNRDTPLATMPIQRDDHDHGMILSGGEKGGRDGPLLRRLRVAEQWVLAAKLKDKTLPARWYQRYRIVGEYRAGGRSVVAVADRVGCNVMSVYRWRNSFNENGFARFEVPSNPRWGADRLRRAGAGVDRRWRWAIPEDLGLPFTHWSVAKLHAYCSESTTSCHRSRTSGCVACCIASRRRLVSAQQDLEGVPRTPSPRWKKPRPRPLRRAAAGGGGDLFRRVRPGGVASAPRTLVGAGRTSGASPAIYRRLQGTEQLLAFYDVHAVYSSAGLRKRKTHQDLLAVSPPAARLLLGRHTAVPSWTT